MPTTEGVVVQSPKDASGLAVEGVVNPADSKHYFKRGTQTFGEFVDMQRLVPGTYTVSVVSIDTTGTQTLWAANTTTRKWIGFFVDPDSLVNLFVRQATGVNSSNGMKIKPGKGFGACIQNAWYGAAASGTVTVYVVEVT
jgi:hypothetical protein